MTELVETFQDHKGMMVKLSRRAQSRLERAGFAVEFNDLMQEAQITFIKAAQGFDPQAGVKFSTYLWNALSNNLNRACDRVRDAQRGKVSLETPIGDESGSSLLDVLADDNAETPEAILQRHQNAAETLRGFSPKTRRVLTYLITQPEPMMREYSRIRAYYDHARSLGHAGPRVKFGVDMICEILCIGKSDRREIKTEIKTFMEG